MQKKILLSLLMASPTALPALADINLGSGTWVPSGVSGEEVNIDNATGSVTCQLGSGVTTWAVANLMPGEYTLSFESTTNLNVQILQGTKVLAEAKDGEASLDFKMTAAGDVTIRTQGVVAGMYAFSGANLSLIFDFVKAGNNLQSAFDALPDYVEITDETFPGAKALLDEKALLVNEGNGYQQTIDKMIDPATSDLALESIYKTQQLYADKSVIAANIEALGGKIEEWNEKAEALNTAIKNTADNKAAKADLLAEQADLLKAIEALIKQIEAGSKYGNDSDMPAAKALQTKIEDYAKAINTAYADDKLAGEITFASQTEALQKEIDELQAKWNADEADWEAYTTFMNTVYPDLQDANDNAEEAIGKLEGLKGYENIFEKQKDKALTEVATTFNEAKGALNITSAAGAAALLEGDQATVAAAKEDIAKIVDDLTELVNTQNANATEAFDKIAEFNTEFQKYQFKDDEVPPTLKEAYDEAVEAVTEALADLREYVGDEYSKAELDLTDADYLDKVKAVEDALKDLEEVAAPFAEIVELLKRFEDARAYVEKVSKPITIVNIYDMFNKPDGSFESIENAIKNLTTEEEVNAQKADIQAAIDDVEATADKLAAVFTDLQAAQAEYAKDVTDLKAFVDGKLELDKTGASATALKTAFMAPAGEGGKFVDGKTTLDTEVKKLTELASTNKNPQNVYDEAVALQEKYVVGEGEDQSFTWEPGLDEMMLDFAKKVTDSNKKYLDENLDAVKAYVAEGEYAGKDTIDFTDADKTLADIEAAITAAADAKDPIKAYGDADTDIQKAFGSFGDIKATAEKYKQNQKDYDELLASLDVPQEAIDALIEKNEAESKDNAKDYFANIINGENNKGSIQAQLDKIKDDLKTALDKFANEKENVTGKKSDFEQAIETLNGLIEKTATDIDNNNFAHNQQLNKAEEVAEAIVKALEDLEKYYNDQEEIDEWYNETKETIEGLRDTDLFNNNVAVAQAYGKGESFTSNDTLMGVYDDILDKVNDLTKSMKDDYTKAVIAANEQTVKDAKWDADKKAMNDAYVSAISEFNAYYYGLNNQGWKAAVLEVVKRHEEIYQYSQKINELIAEVNKFISDANAVPETFSAEEFAAAATEKADAMIKAMEEAVDNLNAEAEAEAVKYYNKLHGDAKAQIDGYKDLLEKAGIDESCLNEVKNALKTAEEGYAFATSDKATEPLGLAMDEIADDLDKALQTIDLQPVAEAAWNKAYGEAMKSVDTILKGLNNPASPDYKFADADLRAENAEKIAEKLDDLAELNTEVTGVKEGLIDSYPDYKKQLDELMKEIEDLDKEVKDDSANNKANEELYNNLTGTVIPDLYDAYSQLMDYAGSLAGGTEFDGSSIKFHIDDFKDFVERNPGSLAKQTWIEGFLNSLYADINNAYPQIAYDEIQFLNGTLLTQLKEAFNDAKAAYLKAQDGDKTVTSKVENEEQLNGWNDEVDGFTAKINALQPTNPFNKAKFQSEAQALEGEMYDLYAELEQTWTGEKHDGENPAETAKYALEQSYTEVEMAIEEAKEYLEGCHADLDTTEYKQALDAASDAIEAEQADWESVGNRVIGLQPAYEAALEEVKANVAATLEDLKAANEEAIKQAEKKAANEAAYADLSAELDDLKAEYERVKNLAEGWYGDRYAGTLDYIETLIGYAEEALEDSYKAIGLTASSKLPYGTDISAQLTGLESRVVRQKANDTQGEAYTAINGVQNTILRSHFVPEEEETLMESLRELWNGYNDNQKRQYGYDEETESYDVASVTVEVLMEVIEEYQRLAEEAGSLETTATEQAYVPGDVDLNPDGIVTAADVQQIIRWVLEGTTWEELEAENPRQAYAADLNEDRQLNITDVTLDIAAMFGESPAARRVARFAAPAMDLETAVALEYAGEFDGLHRYAVCLTNGMPMIAGQLDLKLGDGMRLAGISTVERTGSHDIQTLENGNGLTRVVLFSKDNAEFSGNTGAILFIDVEGEGEMKVENVKLTDTFFRTHEPGANGSSIVDSIMDSAKEIGSRIYNAAGMMFDKLQQGINIIRDKDGKTRKQYNRK